MNSETWLPILTLVLGYLGRLLTESLDARRVRSREREAREAKRAEERQARLENFQRETLLALQEVLLQLGRGTGGRHTEDLVAYQQTGSWQKQLVGEWDEKLREAHAQVSTLRVRLQDDFLRELVEQLQKECDEVLMNSSRERSEAAFADAVKTFNQCQDRIGELLRALDA